MASFLIGPFGSAYDTSNYTEIPDYRYVRGQDVKPFVLRDTDPRYIKKEDYERLKKYALKPQDILVSVVGTLGNACIVKKSDVPAIFSCKSTVIRGENINPYYLMTYLNSKYGRALLLRKERGAIQKGLNLDDLKELDVPLFADSLYIEVQNLLVESESLFVKSKEAYFDAEEILDEKLGFNTFKEPKEVFTVKNFSQTFVKSSRLDAEYYQKKYDELFDRLSLYNTKKLGDIVNISKSIEPGSDAYCDDGVPFVRVSDLSKYEIKSPDIHIHKLIYPGIEKLYPKKDTILLSKDGSVGIAYKVRNDLECVTSSAILHLNIKDELLVQADYLTLILNSKVVQLQAERDAGGSIIQHWKPSEIENVIIPILDTDIQSIITELIEKSFYFREIANRKLKEAVQLVETAIEKGD